MTKSKDKGSKMKLKNMKVSRKKVKMSKGNVSTKSKLIRIKIKKKKLRNAKSVNSVQTKQGSGDQIKQSVDNRTQTPTTSMSTSNSTFDFVPKVMEKMAAPTTSISTSIASTTTASVSPITESPVRQEVKEQQKQMKQVPPNSPLPHMSAPHLPALIVPKQQQKQNQKQQEQQYECELKWELSQQEFEHVDKSNELVKQKESLQTPKDESDEEEPELPNSVLQYLKSEKYTMVKYVVSSTTCSVYQVQNRAGQCRAAKVIDHSTLPELFRDEHLPNELSIIRSVKHLNIVRVDAVLTELPNYSIIISEFAVEGDLTGFIERNADHPPSIAQLKQWFLGITTALDYLHRQFIAHRDIKLDNILLCQDLTAKLTDFGFAMHCRDSEGKPVLCETFCGTTEYQAPETLLCEGPYDGMIADCYSLGVVLYVMFTSKFPFGKGEELETNEGLVALQKRIQAKQWAKIGPIEHDRGMQSLLLQLLNPEIDERIQVRQAIEHYWISGVTNELDKTN